MPVALGRAALVPDVVGERVLLLLEPLDAFDEGAQVIGVDLLGPCRDLVLADSAMIDSHPSSRKRAEVTPMARIAWRARDGLSATASGLNASAQTR